MTSKKKDPRPPVSINISRAAIKEYAYTISAILLFFSCIGILFLIAYDPPHTPSTLFGVDIHLTALVSGVIFSAIGGLICFDASNPSAPDVFHPGDKQLMRKAVENGFENVITQYLRLRNMRGITGFFHKLGLQGLPIATIFMTLIFTFSAILSPSNETRKTLFDLAQLTLGAFIGSFVQRSLDPSTNHPPHSQNGSASPQPPSTLSTVMPQNNATLPTAGQNFPQRQDR